MSKRKEILHLREDELAVVWTIDDWKHLVLVYEILAERESQDSHEKQLWLEAADHIRGQIEKNATDQWGE